MKFPQQPARKNTTTGGVISHDEINEGLCRLALRNITMKWARMSHIWRPAMNQFAILYPDRFVPTSA